MRDEVVVKLFYLTDFLVHIIKVYIPEIHEAVLNVFCKLCAPNKHYKKNPSLTENYPHIT